MRLGEKYSPPRLGSLMERGLGTGPGESEAGHWDLPRWRNDLEDVPAFSPLDY